MATVLPFPVRGEWTPDERARLDELAAHFASTAGVELVFGRSDSGDPWCVVLDAQDEVLVHVAREAGRFVLHAAADDVVVRTPDLRSALDRLLGSRWLEERSDVVVPFAGAGRSIQVVTAILVIGSFVEHHRAEAEPADDWLAAARPFKSGPREAPRDDAAKVVAAIGLEPDPSLRPDLTAATAAGTGIEAPLPAPALRHDDVPEPEPGRQLAAQLITEAAALDGHDGVAALVGSDGSDRLDGRAPEIDRPQLIDAGGGDDVLLLDHDSIAIGGEGADRFVVAAPAPTPEPPLLGILVDFEPGVDVIAADGGANVVLLRSAPVADILGGIGTTMAPALPGLELLLDLDGDASPDGYLLVNGAAPGAELLTDLRHVFGVDVAPAAIVEPASEPIMLAPSTDVA